jgi:curved DNA-binding protein CbpA
VPFDADDTEIASAYRALARRHHPDLAGEAATRRMSEINAAFDVLRDPRRRDQYDRELDAEDVAAGKPGVRAARRRADRARATSGPKRTVRGRAHHAATTEPRHSPVHPGHGRHPERDGTGGAGPAPGRPSGSVLDFGRHLGWSIGEIARMDPGYLEWLEGRREAAPYLDEIDQVLVQIGFRSAPKRPQPVASRAKGRKSRT